MNVKSLGIITLLLTTTAEAKFEGELELAPDDCEETRSCVLQNTLRYTDSNGDVWQADAGLKTDGASIPSWAQPFIGKPYDKSYLKAAVIHDHYCDRHVKPWRDTHKVFYHAMIDLKVPKAKAKVMYYAVYVGGPKWAELIPGNNCGANCINNIPNFTGTSGIQYQQADYKIDGFSDELKEIEQLLNNNPDMGLEELSELAEQKHSDNYYYKHGHRIEINDETGITR